MSQSLLSVKEILHHVYKIDGLPQEVWRHLLIKTGQFASGRFKARYGRDPGTTEEMVDTGATVNFKGSDAVNRAQLDMVREAALEAVDYLRIGQETKARLRQLLRGSA